MYVVCVHQNVWEYGKKALPIAVQSSNLQYINHMYTMFILPCSESFATTCYRNQNIYLHTLAIKTGSDLWQWHCTHEEHSTSVVMINKGLISPYTAGYCTMFLVIFPAKSWVVSPQWCQYNIFGNPTWKCDFVRRLHTNLYLTWSLLLGSICSVGPNNEDV